MNTAKQNEYGGEGFSPAEETLRLIARISAPEGLEERVQTGLRKAKSPVSRSTRTFAWLTALRLDGFWLQSNLARTAIAAAIVCLVVGGGWGVSSRFLPTPPSSVTAIPPHVSGQGGFSSAGAMRTPQTLNGPIVAHPAVAHPSATAAQPAATTAKPATKTPGHRGKSASASKAVVQPAAPAPKAK